MKNIFDIFKSIEKEKGAENRGTTLGAPEFIIAFLGNPGEKYTRTRHNAGFMCAEHISKKHGIAMDRAKFRSLYGEAVFGGKKTLFLKPQTFMNLSGEAIKEAVSFYKLDPASQLLVVYDDIYLDTGRLRIREKGSDGGHNGIKSIVQNLGTDAFKRIRVGVGKPPEGYSMIDHVLGKIPEAEWEAFISATERVSLAAELIVRDKLSEAMNKYNG